jgi:hypothetical protein
MLWSNGRWRRRGKWMVAISTGVEAILPEQMWRGLSLRIEGLYQMHCWRCYLPKPRYGSRFYHKRSKWSRDLVWTLAAKGKFSFFTGRSFGCKGSLFRKSAPLIFIIEMDAKLSRTAFKHTEGLFGIWYHHRRLQISYQMCLEF